MDIAERWRIADQILDALEPAPENFCDWCGVPVVVTQRRGKHNFCCVAHSREFYRKPPKGHKIKKREPYYVVLEDTTPIDEFGNDCRFKRGAVIPRVEYFEMRRQNIFYPGTVLKASLSHKVVVI